MMHPPEKSYNINLVYRTYWRDGSHPYPGIVTREERSWTKRNLRRWEVEELGLREALRRADLRKRAKSQRIETRSERRKVRRSMPRPSAAKVINMPSRGKQRKGK